MLFTDPVMIAEFERRYGEGSYLRFLGAVCAVGLLGTWAVIGIGVSLSG
jgi:hypothetical protein